MHDPPTESRVAFGSLHPSTSIRRTEKIALSYGSSLRLAHIIGMNWALGKELFTRASDFLATQGASVSLDTAGENLIRGNSGTRVLGAHLNEGRPIEWIVEVQGWVNLAHELAHILQSGRLAEDSGFEYERIPLNLSNPRDRAYLWDELCACAVSCAYYAEYPSPPESVTRKVDVASECESIHAWFREQVEILPVFYGMEGDASAFVSRVKSTMLDFGSELEWAERRVFALVEQVLGDRVDGPDAKVQFPGKSTVDLLEAANKSRSISDTMTIEDDIDAHRRSADFAVKMGCTLDSSIVRMLWRGYAENR